jgi:hypothetical protein
MGLALAVDDGVQADPRVVLLATFALIHLT